MGCLECRRSECWNIMCDRYSIKYGYLCEECFEELTQMPEGSSIQEFMESDKGSCSRRTMQSEAQEEFPERVFDDDEDLF